MSGTTLAPIINLGTAENLQDLEAHRKAAVTTGLQLDIYKPGTMTPFGYIVPEGFTGMGLQRGDMLQMRDFWEQKKRLYMSPSEIAREMQKKENLDKDSRVLHFGSKEWFGN